MKAHDTYLRYVRWDEVDAAYIGYCPDLFPHGGICHADSEAEAYSRLCALVEEEVQDLQARGRPLPAPSTRPMRDAVAA